ncbi:MAG: glucan 1,4-alpha-glucosidase [Mesorhizobium sp.]|uniref:glucan 1,4-alpha-glucosidase n=1 Tax=Mesorhizobium sp. TaxID=1871066 RepID=UPI001AC2FEF8|nr:glucan 1,4-alpha-glucosidase [Mesorhizobium sp.]MBN9219868.1 glucan 1,4-alpha-glucosidase [Mesorhizobium sp.]
MAVTPTVAQGAPGIPARWTSSAKSGVGTALSAKSPLWFTVSHGILNEIYYPRLDSACTRDLGLIVTGPGGYFSEEKRDAAHAIEPFEAGVPAYRLTNTADAYRIDKRILADPARPALLQEITFTPLKGSAGDYRVYALLAPHLVNAGMGNTAWVGDHEGKPVLFASGRGTCLALVSSLSWRDCSAGYVGFSDGWQQLHNGGRLDPACQRAEDGNVALTGEIGFTPASTKAVLALGFGATPDEAAQNAFASLKRGFEPAAKSYVANWREWQQGLLPLDRHASGTNTYRTSTAVLATHRSIRTPGAAVASLSIPWGFNKGDDDLGGYHLVWPRDLVETAGGFLAAGDADSALRILEYLRSIQQPDGHWSQNAWLDGSAYWPGIQMDECAFPLLLADALHRTGHLPHARLKTFLPMIERAAGYVTRNGPVTGEDRWEEDAGFSPFTLAVEIAALLAGADLLGAGGKHEEAAYLRETADCWNEQVERWTYVTDTATCKAAGVEGYYVRIAPPDSAEAGSPKDGYVPIKNRPPGDTDRPAQEIVSPDALALVRFGLRAADDPRIVNTVKVIDAQLRRDLPQGPLWYRYNGDGYGEHEDGAPFDGTGQGRPWPLLAGERAHYELTAGRKDAALGLLGALEGSAEPGGLLPEQVWDSGDMPERELLCGRPSGSAMPLVWAHSEHIKLLRSLRDGIVFDMPPQGVKRYIEDRTVSPFRTWRFNNKIRALAAGKTLRIELLAAATVHWSTDNWASAQDSKTKENAFGVHLVDLPVAGLPSGSSLIFTFFWPGTGDWENVDFSVILGDQDSQ